MPVPMFGQFLLQKGLIDQRQLMEALAKQRRSNSLFGDLAVARGYMTTAQVADVVSRQSDVDERFGTIAVQMGLIKQNQADELLIEQDMRRQRIGSILVELGFVTARVMESAIAEHAALDAPPAARTGDPVLDTVLQLSREIFAKLYLRHFRLTAAIEDLEVPQEIHGPAYKLSFSVKVRPYGVVFVPTAQHSKAVAQEHGERALGKICGIAMGLFAIQLSQLDPDMTNQPLQTADASALLGETDVTACLNVETIDGEALIFVGCVH